MQLGMRGQACRLDLGDLRGQHQPQFRIFVADVEIGVGGFHDPGRDQHALDEAVRIALEIEAVLEGAWLAFVGIDREQARCRFRAHQLPFASGGKSGAAETTQAGITDDLNEFVDTAPAGKAVFQQRVAAVFLIGGEIGTGFVRLRMLVRLDVGRDLIGRRLEGLQMPDGSDRRAVAGAHAGRAHHAHILAEDRRQFLQQRLRANHGAGQRIADAHRDGRRHGAVLHHVEMRVEGGDLVDFGLCQLHLLRQCCQMRGGQMPVMVLDEMQMLDQQIATARPVGEQRAHLVERRGVDLAALGGARRPAPAGAVAAGTRRNLHVHCGLQNKI